MDVFNGRLFTQVLQAPTHLATSGRGTQPYCSEI